MRATRVEVCIVGYEARDTIAAAVRSVAQIPGATVAFVEHAADPASIDVATAQAQRCGLVIRTEHDPSNPGFGAGVNRLAASSEADWLLLLNPDAEVIEWPWGPQLMPPPNAIVGAAQVLPGGRPIRAWGRRYRVRDEIARSWLRYTPRPRGGRGFVGGGAMFIARAVFNELGGFDERFFLFYEDIDLCCRGVSAGCEVMVNDAWSVRHALGSSTRRDWPAALATSYRSARLFHELHDHSRVGYDVYVAADSLVRWAVSTIRRDHRAEAYRSLFTDASRYVLSTRRTPSVG